MAAAALPAPRCPPIAVAHHLQTPVRQASQDLRLFWVNKSGVNHPKGYVFNAPQAIVDLLQCISPQPVLNLQDTGSRVSRRCELCGCCSVLAGRPCFVMGTPCGIGSRTGSLPGTCAGGCAYDKAWTDEWCSRVPLSPPPYHQPILMEKAVVGLPRNVRFYHQKKEEWQARFKDPPPLKYMKHYREQVAACLNHDFVNERVRAAWLQGLDRWRLASGPGRQRVLHSLLESCMQRSAGTTPVFCSPRPCPLPHTILPSSKLPPPSPTTPGADRPGPHHHSEPALRGGAVAAERGDH